MIVHKFEDSLRTQMVPKRYQSPGLKAKFNRSQEKEVFLRNTNSLSKEMSNHTFENNVNGDHAKEEKKISKNVFFTHSLEKEQTHAIKKATFFPIAVKK